MASVSLTAKQIAELCNGKVLQEATGQRFQFDSRLIGKNEWFVVLQGARDGHDFLPMAQRKECAGAIGQHMPDDWTGGFIQVDDSLLAFQQIAHGLRQRFQGPVVGVTGSAGKTTTRAMIASVLKGLGDVHQTKRNFNNHIGVPKTITDASGQEAAWVLEMGMSALGEIHRLQEIGEPSIRVITNIGAAHIEGCGSIEGVAQAKGELFDGARSGDICCVNLDDHRVANRPIPDGVNILTYGKHPDAAIQLLSNQVGDWSTAVVIRTPNGTIEATIPVPGEFMALNACAAVAAGIAAKVPLDKIQSGLEGYTPVGMRMRLEKLGHFRIINDAYNANPLSMKAALTTLSSQSTANKIAFLGDMLEMGSAEESGHQEVLQHAFDLQLTVGLIGPRFIAAWNILKSQFPNATVVCAVEKSPDVLAAWKPATNATTILLKGSRGMKVEQILSDLQERYQ